ncbi:hypothetical protein ABT364_25860 [Massilia sp. SR12]
MAQQNPAAAVLAFRHGTDEFGIATVDERLLQLTDLSTLLADVTAAAALPLAA